MVAASAETLKLEENATIFFFKYTFLTVFHWWLNSTSAPLQWRFILHILDFNSCQACLSVCLSVWKSGVYTKCIVPFLSQLPGKMLISWQEVPLSTAAEPFSSFTILFSLIGAVQTHTHTSDGDAALSFNLPTQHFQLCPAGGWAIQ